MNMTHPGILDAERNGMPEDERERITCPNCEAIVDELIYCEWQGCQNKRCTTCMARYFDPVLGDRNRMATPLVCEECAEEILDIADAKAKRTRYEDLLVSIEKHTKDMSVGFERGFLLGILKGAEA